MATRPCPDCYDGTVTFDNPNDPGARLYRCDTCHGTGVVEDELEEECHTEDASPASGVDRAGVVSGGSAPARSLNRSPSRLDEQHMDAWHLKQSLRW